MKTSDTFFPTPIPERGRYPEVIPLAQVIMSGVTPNTYSEAKK